MLYFIKLLQTENPSCLELHSQFTHVHSHFTHELLPHELLLLWSHELLPSLPPFALHDLSVIPCVARTPSAAALVASASFIAVVTELSPPLLLWRSLRSLSEFQMSLLLELYELISAKEAVINGGDEINGLIALFHQVFYQLDPKGGLKELVDPRLGDNLGLEIITQLIQFSSKKVSLFVKDITPVRQMVMFSATWPLPVHQLA
ncbi:hypothetical protein Ahy_B10g105611 isoform B [Arachis hypogaea]|uniref:Uncharacterized protein n=1 Tax=Arachis hypogaea TaxID=3818 RepID=A0A444X8G3_ARAHY|nr:hypothetical protein Ahy_B10g105611 isoform B [Arachis hypogaea]